METYSKKEYNILCAKFLGWVVLSNTNDECFIHEDYPFDVLHISDFNFDSDWNQIMDVVKKIVLIAQFKTIDECDEEEWYTTIGLTRLTITTKKELVVQAIWQFLNWHMKERFAETK